MTDGSRWIGRLDLLKCCYGDCSGLGSIENVRAQLEFYCVALCDRIATRQQNSATRSVSRTYPFASLMLLLISPRNENAMEDFLSVTNNCLWSVTVYYPAHFKWSLLREFR